MQNETQENKAETPQELEERTNPETDIEKSIEELEKIIDMLAEEGIFIGDILEAMIRIIGCNLQYYIEKDFERFVEDSPNNDK